MIVVSDTSPITSLAGVEKLEILRALFDNVLIPPAVFRELEDRVALPDWIEVRNVREQAMVTHLLAELDSGEAEALALARELKADRVLIDERHGRDVAERLGLRYIGVLGVLLEAKRRGHLEAVGPIVDALVAKARFWVSEKLRREVLQAAGEA
ncbi:MAG: DUF3368 domain-containing protein [Candidatus Binatia bacterium]